MSSQGRYQIESTGRGIYFYLFSNNPLRNGYFIWLKSYQFLDGTKTFPLNNLIIFRLFQIDNFYYLKIIPSEARTNLVLNSKSNLMKESCTYQTVSHDLNKSAGVFLERKDKKNSNTFQITTVISDNSSFNK